MKKMNLKAALIMAVFFLLNVASVAFAANTEPRLGFSSQVLNAASQAATAWTNVIPNALASYFTYTPYKNADAVTLGFPSTCGNPTAVGATAQDLVSTEDCYTISVREFNQQMAVPGTFGGGAGLLKRDGLTAFGAATRAWGYGSGGSTPSASTPTWPTGVPGNAPSIGPFAIAGVWHAPAPTIKGTKGRPVRVQWVNELASTVAPPTGLDPTTDCGMNAPYCYPYNRIVTHMHGGHTGPESDGYADSWFTAGLTFGAAPTLTGATYNGPAAAPWVKPAGPVNTYLYPMDQDGATLWYHDHAMGTTHTNTQMGMAGFFPVTDDNEKCLQGVAGIVGCPAGQTKLLPTGAYELGFALQDRVFTPDGQFAMPDYPIYDLNTGLPGGSPPIAFIAGTVPPVGIPCALLASGLADPSTCQRLDWMKAADGHLIPYVAGSPLLANANNALAPFPAPNMTLEYFGNMPMVNGVTYGMYQVEPQIYRMRFIGGNDSRTYIMQIQNRVGGAIVPMYQIGSDQGFLNAPVARNSIVLMDGERVDVLVDFRGFAVGTKFVMKNLGPDAPYNGNSALVDPSQAVSVDIPEIMEFDVVTANAVYGTVPAQQATGIPALPTGTIPVYISNLRPVLGPIQTPTVTLDASGTPLPERLVSLKEIQDVYGRTMPTIDTRGFMANPLIPTTEIVRINDTEQWDIINTTIDGHPMHLHQVAFKVMYRTPFNRATFVPAVNDTVNGIFQAPKYTPIGPSVPPDAWDAGWKDTVFSPPGFVTTVRAKFDLIGLYVWHCHILSHEEHDMMRPMEVVQPLGAVTLTGLPAAGAVAANAGPVNFTAAATATAATGAVEYRFSYQLNGSGKWGVGQDYSAKATWAWDISTVAPGLYTVKVDARNIGSLRDSESTLSSGTYTISLAAGPATITSPANRATLTATSQIFTWTNTGATQYNIWVGSTPGGSNLGAYVNATSGVTNTINLPFNGSTVYVRLWSLVAGTWAYNDYIYTATSPAAMVSPANNATLTGPSQIFSWNNAGAVQYNIWVGSTPGAYDLGNYANATSGVTNVTGLFIDGRNVYIRLWSSFAGTWVYKDFTYKSGSAAILTPANAATLTGTSQIFTWTNSGATQYNIWVGSALGGSNLGAYTAATSGVTNVTGLPINGSTVYVRLWALFAGTWAYKDFTYTATGPAAITSPAGTFLAGPTQTLSWTNAGATQYNIWVGSTLGGYDLGSYANATNGVTSVTGLPANGSTIYVRLWSSFAGTWVYKDFTYTSVP